MCSSCNERIRFLCLGNDLLADDAVGLLIAQALAGFVAKHVEVVESMESGLRLMDYLMDVSHLVVVDSIQTGKGPPGTIHVIDGGHASPCTNLSPHYIGLFEAQALGTTLGLPVAHRLSIFAVEARDCQTIGGSMDEDVLAAVEKVVQKIQEEILTERPGCTKAVL